MVAEEWRLLLTEKGADEPLLNVIDGLLQVCSDISTALRNTGVEALGLQNSFGDEQLSVDLLAEKLLRKFAQQEVSVKAVSSEEDTVLTKVHEKGEFILCWDPLDGSSIVDCNWSVGTIVGIWRLHHHGLLWKEEDTLLQQTGRQQVAAMVVMYGPRTTAVVAVNPQQEQQQQQRPQGEREELLVGNAIELRLVDAEKGCKTVVTRHPCIIKPQAKIFSPANLRASQDLPEYERLIQYWLKKRYTLRYTGGFVPDVYQIFVKQQGIFCNPASTAAPAKLRMCFEVLPLALLIEAAGGKTSDGKQSLLAVPIEHMDHRTSFCGGSADEVRRIEDAVTNGSNSC